jgi:hypothetical protein
MREYPHVSFVQQLVDISNYGASIGYTGPRAGRVFSRNLPATPSEHTATAADILTNLELGELRRVDDLPAHIKCRVFNSPIGSVPKSSGGCRTIHHLSYPDGSSINDGIPLSAVTLVYTTLGSLFSPLRKFGRGAFILKMDLKRAFRHISVCPDDTLLYGFYFDGVGYVDLRLPFG